MSKYIRWFDEINSSELRKLGTKVSSIVELSQERFSVPFGFVVPSFTFKEFISDETFKRDLNNVLNDSGLVKAKVQKIQKLVQTKNFSLEMMKQIIESYGCIFQKENEFLKSNRLNLLEKTVYTLQSVYRMPYVAIRLSLEDDAPIIRNDTFLNVRGEATVLRKIQDLWVEVITAYLYQGITSIEEIADRTNVIVQRMLKSDTSGNILTENPEDPKELIIEAIYGVDEYLPEKIITADTYTIDRYTLVITSKDIAKQEKKLIRKGLGNGIVQVPDADQKKQKISDEFITRLTLKAKDLGNYFRKPLRIVWAIERDQIYVLETTPTASVFKEPVEENQFGKFEYIAEETDDDQIGDEADYKRAPYLSGITIFPGNVSGTVRKKNTLDHDQPFSLSKSNDVLVVKEVEDISFELLESCAGIITEDHNITSAELLRARKIGIPIIADVSGATALLDEGQAINMDAFHGNIYLSDQEKEYKYNKHPSEKTDTSLDVQKEDNSQQLIKIEDSFLVSVTSFNQMHHLHQDNKIDVIIPANELITSDEAISDKNLYVRSSSPFEISEIERMNNNSSQKTYIIEEIHSPEEYIRFSEEIKQELNKNTSDMSLYLSCSYPSSVIEFDRFVELGINGIVLDIKRLTTFILGVTADVSNPSFDPRNSAVLKTLLHVIEVSQKHKLTIFVEVFEPRRYPELYKQLIDRTIDKFVLSYHSYHDSYDFLKNIIK